MVAVGFVGVGRTVHCLVWDCFSEPRPLDILLLFPPILTPAHSFPILLVSERGWLVQLINFSLLQTFLTGEVR